MTEGEAKAKQLTLPCGSVRCDFCPMASYLSSLSTNEWLDEDKAYERGLQWMNLLQTETFACRYPVDFYERLANQPSSYDTKIRRDIARTFPQDLHFKRSERENVLFRVLHAYSVFDEETGYCQGMAFIAGILLLHIPEELAFWSFCQMLGGVLNLRVLYDSRNHALHECMTMFDRLLKTYRPALHQHMRNEGIDGFMYNSHWFLTFFSYRFPSHAVPVVWDQILAHGFIIVFKLGLRMLAHFEEALLRMDFEQLLKFFGDKPDVPDDLLLNISDVEVSGLTDESVDLFRFGWTQSSLLGLRKDSKLHRAQTLQKRSIPARKIDRSASFSHLRSSSSNSNAGGKPFKHSTSRRRSSSVFTPPSTPKRTVKKTLPSNENGARPSRNSSTNAIGNGTRSSRNSTFNASGNGSRPSRNSTLNASGNGTRSARASTTRASASASRNGTSSRLTRNSTLNASRNGARSSRASAPTTNGSSRTNGEHAHGKRSERLDAPPCEEKAPSFLSQAFRRLINIATGMPYHETEPRTKSQSRS